jgi:hypothetical protein
MTALLICNRQVLGSNRGWDTGYSDRRFLVFISPSDNYLDNTSIRQRLFYSKSCPVHRSSVILSFEAIQYHTDSVIK